MSLTARQLKNIVMHDVRQRVVLLRPGRPPFLSLREDVDVHLFMRIERLVASESAVLDVASSSILASCGYCAEDSE